MADMSATAATPRKRHALQLFAGLPRHYDRVGAALSFGQDPRWRRAMVAQVRARPQAPVADVAPVTGMVAAEPGHGFGANVVVLAEDPVVLAGALTRLPGDPALGER